jgi:hypothetical protein
MLAEERQGEAAGDHMAGAKALLHQDGIADVASHQVGQAVTTQPIVGQVVAVEEVTGLAERTVEDGMRQVQGRAGVRITIVERDAEPEIEVIGLVPAGRVDDQRSAGVDPVLHVRAVGVDEVDEFSVSSVTAIHENHAVVPQPVADSRGKVQAIPVPHPEDIIQGIHVAVHAPGFAACLADIRD